MHQRSHATTRRFTNNVIQHPSCTEAGKLIWLITALQVLVRISSSCYNIYYVLILLLQISLQCTCSISQLCC